MSWFTSELRVRLVPWNYFKPFKKYVYWPFQGGASFLDHFCYLCIVFVMLSCLFIAALWSPDGKGLAFWLSSILRFIVFLSLSHVVSWVRCGTWLYRFLIFASLLIFIEHFESRIRFGSALSISNKKDARSFHFYCKLVLQCIVAPWVIINYSCTWRVKISV